MLWGNHTVSGDQVSQPPVRHFNVNIKYDRPFHDQVLLEVFEDPGFGHPQLPVCLGVVQVTHEARVLGE